MLKVAVVGLGWWGRIICGLLKGSPKLSLAAAADVDPAAEGFARDLGVLFSRDFSEIIQGKDIEGVILCTPHSQHCEQIVRAAQANKHVFCEKPLSLARADVLKAVAACNANKVALAVGHEKRFEPPVQALFGLVKEGALGTPLQIEANFSQDKFLSLPADNWRLSESEAPAGPMTATGIHLLDLAVGLMGPAESVLARVRQFGSQLRNGDTLGLLVTHESGGNSLISAILATPFEGRFAVYGSKGWAEVRDKAHPEAPEGWVLTVHEETREKPRESFLLQKPFSRTSRRLRTRQRAERRTRCRRSR